MTGVAVALPFDDSQSMNGVCIHALRTSDTDRRVLLEKKKTLLCFSLSTADPWLTVRSISDPVLSRGLA